MFGLYTIMDRDNIPRLMRAKTIYKKTMEDSKKSNYNWFASTLDLIYVCTLKNFPEEYAINIKTAVINCYANLLNDEFNSSPEKKEELEAIYYAYNSLFEIKEEIAIKTRYNFLNSYLTKIYHDSMSYIIHPGKTINNLFETWKTNKINELLNIPVIDFNNITHLLKEEFQSTIKNAQKNGTFLSDDIAEENIQRKILNDWIENIPPLENVKKRIKNTNNQKM